MYLSCQPTSAPRRARCISRSERQEGLGRGQAGTQVLTVKRCDHSRFGNALRRKVYQNRKGRLSHHRMAEHAATDILIAARAVMVVVRAGVEIERNVVMIGAVGVAACMAALMMPMVVIGGRVMMVVGVRGICNDGLSLDRRERKQ